MPSRPRPSHFAAVKDEQGNITALQLTATDIRAGLRDAQQNLAAVELTAQQLQTALTNAQGISLP